MYVELHCHSAYSFLDGASQPEELAARAAELGYEALALTDHDGVYGSLEFAHAAKAFGVRPITGAEVTLEGGAHVTLLVETPQGYANLCRLLTEAHAGTRPKAEREPLPPALPLEALLELNDGLVCLSGCARHGLGVRDPNAAARVAARLRPRALLRRAPAAVRARRRAPQRRACASSPATSASRPSPPATSTRTTRGAPRSRTRSSRSAAAPRSTAASRSGAATTRPCCVPPDAMARALPGRPRRRRAHRASSPSGSTFDLTAGARLPLPRLLRRRRDPPTSSSARVCERRLRRALRRLARCRKRARSAAATRSSP